MNTADIDDLIKKIDDVTDWEVEYITRNERDLIIDALVFYKEMQVI